MKRSIITILASAFISVSVTVWLNARSQPPLETLRVRNIEIVDRQNRLRGTIGLGSVSGHETPELTLRSAEGRVMVLLSLNDQGDGTLYFSSEKREGKVAAGYLWGSDVVTSSGSEISDARNTSGAWGLRVVGKDLQTVTVGVTNTGRVLLPPH